MRFRFFRSVRAAEISACYLNGDFGFRTSDAGCQWLVILTTVNSFVPSAQQPGEVLDMKLKIEFSGGLELLFSNTRTHRVDIPFDSPSR
jgi:hypothetical protein